MNSYVEGPAVDPTRLIGASRVFGVSVISRAIAVLQKEAKAIARIGLRAGVCKKRHLTLKRTDRSSDLRPEPLAFAMERNARGPLLQG